MTRTVSSVLQVGGERLLTGPVLRVWIANLGAFTSFGMVVLALPLYTKDELGRAAGIGIAMGAASLTSSSFDPVRAVRGPAGTTPAAARRGAGMVAATSPSRFGLAAVIGIRLIAGAAEATFVVGAYTVIADIAPEAGAARR